MEMILYLGFIGIIIFIVGLSIGYAEGLGAINKKPSNDPCGNSNLNKNRWDYM
jgi:hypothetical protein